jgi:hypothetical protein
MMTKPFAIYCQMSGTPEERPFLIIAMMSAPTRVPQIDLIPPTKLAIPSVTAAIASSS